MTITRFGRRENQRVRKPESLQQTHASCLGQGLSPGRVLDSPCCPLPPQTLLDISPNGECLEAGLETVQGNNQNGLRIPAPAKSRSFHSPP